LVRRFVPILCSLLLLMLNACDSAPSGNTAEMVELQGVSAVVLPENIAEGSLAALGIKTEGLWMPGRADVVSLEIALPAFLQFNAQLFHQDPPIWERLEGYKRQYIGIIENGKKVILANFFCQAKGVDWQKQFVHIQDGGECYFRLKFEVDTRRFFDLVVNQGS
jgi:hypothetical protein